MQSFTATTFQRNPADIFNAVQSDGEVQLDSKSRPVMIVMLKSEHQAMIEKIRQLTALIKAQ